MDKPSSNLYGNFGQKTINDDVRVLNVKIERGKQKIEQLEEKLMVQDKEFRILQDLYEQHLIGYEEAIRMRKSFELEIQNLRNNLDDKINENSKAIARG